LEQSDATFIERKVVGELGRSVSGPGQLVSSVPYGVGGTKQRSPKAPSTTAPSVLVGSRFARISSDTSLRQSQTSLARVQFRERIVWINPFHVENVAVRSDLAMSACLDAVRDAVVSRYSPRTWFKADEEWPVVGAVTGNRFWMQRIHTLERPWLLQQASGVVESDGSGSVVRFRISMKTINAVFAVAVGLIVSVAALLAALWFPAFAPWPPIAWALWPLGALTKYTVDRLWWAGDAGYLSWFVSDVVGAHHRQPWHPYQSAG